MKRDTVDIATQRQYIAAKSQEMKDTVSTMPGWLIRYGLSIFFITLLFIAGFGMALRFPERISAPASVRIEKGIPSITVWIEEKDLSNIQDGQKAVITLQERSTENKFSLEGKTGAAIYSAADKKYFVPVQITADDSKQKLSDGQQAEAQITYRKRTLFQQIMNRSK